MKIPKGYSEAEVLEVIKKIAIRLGKHYTFGIYDIDDLQQEAWFIANKALEKYHSNISLEAFLYLHIKHKLKNLKRDNFSRANLKCDNCEAFDSNCSSCLRREQTELIKRNLHNAIDIANVNPEGESGVTTYDTTIEVDLEEIVGLINNRLPVEYREDYLKLKDNMYLPKARKVEIENLVHKILEDYI